MNGSFLILAVITKLMFGDSLAPEQQRDFCGFRYVEATDAAVCTQGDAKGPHCRGWSYDLVPGATWSHPNKGTVPPDRLLEHGMVVEHGAEVKVPFPDGPCVVHVWVGDWFRAWKRFSIDKVGDRVWLACDGMEIYGESCDKIEDTYREWCRFSDYVFNRNDPQWDRLVKGICREFDFPATAKDGVVTLKGNHLLLAAVAVASSEAEMKATLAETEKARRAMFAARYPWRPQPDEPMPENVKTDGALVFFRKGGNDDVKPWTRPRAEDVTDVVRAFAAQGEQEPFRFGVLPLEDFARLEVELGDFRSADGDVIETAKSVEFWQERYKETGSAAGSGKIEDMCLLDPISYVLTKYRPIPAEAGTPRMYLADVRVPADAKPGDYFADVRVLRDGKLARKARLQLKVLPFRLRTENAAVYGFQMIFNTWARRTPPKTGKDKSKMPDPNDPQWRYMDELCRFIDSYGFSVFHCEPAGAFGTVKGPPGEATFTQTPEQAATMDLTFRLMNPSGKLKYIWAVPKTIFKRCGWKFYVPNFDVRNEKTWTKEKQELWKKTFRDLEYLAKTLDDICKRRGYPEIWWYWNGELDKFGVGGVKLDVEVADMFRRIGVKSHTVINGPIAAKMCPGRFDHVWANPATPVTEEFREACVGKGTGFGIHNGGDYRFQAGFQFWRTRPEGRYQETCFYTDFLAPYVYLPLHWNTAQVYPTPDGGLAPILAFLNYRDGRDDYLYLHTLEEMIAEAPAGSAARKDAEELIRHLEKKIHFDPRAYHAEYYDGIEATAAIRTDEWNADVIERYRWAVATRIMALVTEMKGAGR